MRRNEELKKYGLAHGVGGNGMEMKSSNGGIGFIGALPNWSLRCWVSVDTYQTLKFF